MLRLPLPSRPLLSLSVLVVLLTGATTARADEGQRVAGTLRVGVEYDDNALRLEGERARADAVARYFASLGIITPGIADGIASLDLDHGGKFFVREAGADTLLTQLQLAYQQPLAEHVGAFFALEMKDRTERVSQRDYNRGGLGAGIDLFAGPVFARIGGAWRYFAYKPNPESSSSNLEGSLRLRYAIRPDLFLSAGYTIARRGFDTAPLVLEAEDEASVASVSAVATGTREDTFHVGSVGVGYRGPVVVDASYGYAINTSNSYGQGLTRHGLDLTATLPLFWDLFASAHVELQRTAYDDPVLIDASFIVDEDNRNAFVASLARPLFAGWAGEWAEGWGEDWEVELRYSLYGQEFGVGSDYRRQTLLLALGYLFDT